MTFRFRAVPVVAALGAVLGLTVMVSGQTTSAPIPRTPDGKPNFNGIWQTLNTADWDLQAHAAQQGRIEDGALGAAPPGLSVVDGNTIPYLPAALSQRKANFEKRLTDDPAIKCYMPGVPRATYIPYPFQIVQTPAAILVSYQFANATRVIEMRPLGEAPVDTWMGQSSGRWDGDTLVVDATGFNGKAWLDRSGNYASDELHVVERYTLMTPDAMMYEATIEDKAVFSKPWKISMPVYRRLEKNAQMLEFKCVEFAEELMYGKYTKKPGR
jgi:hypothetical protein